MEFAEHIFNLYGEHGFRELALSIFYHQARQNVLFREFLTAMGVNPEAVDTLEKIPFLPVSFFKTHDVICRDKEPLRIFLSSGTTGPDRSRHLIGDPALYEKSILRGFEHFYGSPEQYRFLALVPEPQENPGSSLITMIGCLMKAGGEGRHGFYLNDFPGLHSAICEGAVEGRKIFLFGLTYALLDFAETFPGSYPDMIVMETGGMKGKQVELTRDELHERLCSAFSIQAIHSEYGMTELLSQAYSSGKGIFNSVPWMKVLIREVNDPLTYADYGMAGGINIIDLANIHSCSFLATQDLGRSYENGSFEVLGRFGDSDIRGCSLMIGD